jgi:hypothetical protein
MAREVEQPADREHGAWFRAVLSDPFDVYASRLGGSADVPLDLICCAHDGHHLSLVTERNVWDRCYQ